MKTQDKFTKAKTLLILDHAYFWGALACKLKFTETRAVPTAATDGKMLLYNPDYIDTLTQDEAIGLVAHEVMHCADGHAWRKPKDADPDLNQQAADYAINPILKEAGFTLPEGYLYSDEFVDKSYEEIYKILASRAAPQPKPGPNKKDDQESKEKQQSPQGQGGGRKPDGQKQEGQPDKSQDGSSDDDQGGKQNGEDQQDGQGKPKEPQEYPPDPGKCGTILEVDDKDDAKQLEEEWKGAVAVAAQMSRGKLPAGLEREIDRVLNPPIPWSALLADFVERTARNDYDWTRANKRYISRDVILPTLVSDELPEVVVFLDTSGSISQEQLSEFAAGVSDILSQYDTTVRAIYCDAKVQGEQEFTRNDLPLEFEPKGGGGTKFEPAFDYIEKHGYEPVCGIYFTDLCGSFPKQEPDYPVLWVVPETSRHSSDKEAPFGVTVKF